MYNFIPLSYDELVSIYHSHKWSLVWTIISPNYIDGCEKILDTNGELIALIYYNKSELPYNIAKFEVLAKYRNLGRGEEIIREFLEIHKCYFELIPLGEDSERFWRKCGFDGDEDLLIYSHSF